MSDALLRGSSTDRLPKPMVKRYRPLRVYKSDILRIYEELSKEFKGRERGVLAEFEFKNDGQNARNKDLFEQIFNNGEIIIGVKLIGYQEGMDNVTMGLGMGNRPELVTLELNEREARLTVINTCDDPAFDGLRERINKILSPREKYRNYLLNLRTKPLGIKRVQIEQSPEPQPLHPVKWTWAHIKEIAALLGIIVLLNSYVIAFINFIIDLITGLIK